MEALGRLFQSMLLRPRHGDRVLPIVVLSGDQATVAQTLTTLGASLGPAVLARCDPTDLGELPDTSSTSEVGSPGLTDLRRLMHRLCQALSADRFGRARPLRFRRYRLAEWLMSQKLTTGDEVAELAGLLRRGFPQWGQELLSDAEAVVGPVERLLLGVVRLVLPSAVFRARVSGRIPFVGSEFRWFMHQPYLAPGQSSRFIGFAVRLTENGRTFELGDQLAKLLVHAFLEDLRVSYRRGPGRFAAARRTTYPVILLEHADAAPAARFLALLNEIRNETGRDDPLCVVADAADAPADPTAAPAQAAEDAYERWTEELPKARQRQRDQAWSLRLTIPETNSPNPIRFRRLPPSNPPWWARRVTPVLAAVTVAAMAAAGIWWYEWYPQHCGSGSSGEWVSLRYIDGTCVGYSALDPGDGGYLFAQSESDNQRLVEAQEAIYAENRKADQVHAQYRQRPLLTLVYLAQLSHLPEKYAPESEDIEGLALAQYQDNEQTDADSVTTPLIRVVLANTGPQLESGIQVVDMLAPLARRNELSGVIGLDQSRRVTKTMVEKLTGLGLPVVASSLSADQMPTTSAMYFQLAPPDQAIAEMIKQYLDDYPQTFAGRAMRIYDERDPKVDPGNDDLYVSDTVTDLEHALAGERYVDRSNWRADGAFERNNKNICPTDILFFAGRDQDFGDFLKALEGSSGCRGNAVTLIADDSANRFMASEKERGNVDNTQALTYVAKASLVTCAQHGDDAAASVVGPDFYNLATSPSWRWNACAPGTLHPLGERVTLSYDAVSLFNNAVQWLTSTEQAADPDNPNAPAIPITSMSLWTAILSQPTPIALTSGALSWTTLPAPPGAPPTAPGHVDVNKWRGLLHVDHISDSDAGTDVPRLVFGCGLITAQSEIDSCRVDPG